MSVVKRILEANNYSRYLPEGWRSSEPSFLSKMYAKQNPEGLMQFVVDAPIVVPLTMKEMYEKLQAQKHKTKSLYKDKNQQSLF